MKQAFQLALLLGIAGNAYPLTVTNSYTPPANIITLRGDADPEAVARDFGLTPARVYQHALKGFAVTVPTNQLESLRQDPRVVAVEGNGRIYPCAQTNSTGFARLGMPQFPMIRFNGVDDVRIDVDVAILDTGVQTNHPDLNVYRAVTFADTNQPPDDWQGHGTQMAGIVGALDNNFGVVGVAPGVRIWSAKVLGEIQSDLDTFISGLDYIAQHSDEISIANASLSNNGDASGTYMQSVRAAISNVVSRGVVLVVAAGNNYSDVFGFDGMWGTHDDFLPAAIPEAMTVSALADFDGMSGEDFIAPFSNYSSSNAPTFFVNSPGKAIDVCAPGYQIASTFTNSLYILPSWGGTSDAAAHVSGLVALYIAANGRATNAAGVYAIRQAIIDSAQPQSEWQTPETYDPDGNLEGLAVPSLSWIPQRRFTSQQRQTNGFELQFTTLPGYAHTVQFTDALESANAWQTLTTTNGTGDIFSVLDETATNTSRYYRLETVPAP